MKKRPFLKITTLSLVMTTVLSSGVSYAQSMDSVFSNLEAFTNNLIAEQSRAAQKKETGIISAYPVSAQEKIPQTGKNSKNGRKQFLILSVIHCTTGLTSN